MGGQTTGGEVSRSAEPLRGGKLGYWHYTTYEYDPCVPLRISKSRLTLNLPYSSLKFFFEQLLIIWDFCDFTDTKYDMHMK